MRRRIDRFDSFAQASAEAQGRMHGHGDTDKCRSLDGGIIQRFDRGIDQRRVESGGLQCRRRRRQAQRLMTKLVTGHEADISVPAEWTGYPAL
jgi:hypothetical protein